MVMSAKRYLEWRDKKREEHRAYQKRYYAENRERIRNRQRMAYRIKGYKGLCNLDYKRMLIAVLRQRDGDLCAICRRNLDDDVTIDHIVSRMLGGTDQASNLQLAHRMCNATKKRGSRKWNGKEING